MILRLISGVVVAILLVVGVAAVAQDGGNGADSSLNACFDAVGLAAAQTACDGIEAGQVCVGAGEAAINAADALTALGDTAEITEIDEVASSDGSLLMFRLQADLPDSADPLRLILFGQATVTDMSAPVDAPYPTITVKNDSGNVLNLRSAPNTDADVIGTMSWSEELPADGRSADGEWLHLDRAPRTDGWVFASLVTPAEGADLSTLAAVDSPITEPMQRFSLVTAAGEDCNGGLLVQSAAGETAHLEVNGALLSFEAATLLLQAAEDDALRINVINGGVTVSAGGESVEASAGGQRAIRVALDGLAAAGAPETAESYAFAELASAPLDLLPSESLVCAAGGAGSIAAYSAPDMESAAGEIDATMIVTGQTTTDDGTTWLLVNDAAWVRQDSVTTAGACGSVEVVAPTALEQQANVSLPPQSSSFEHTLVPEGQSIWQAHTGPDNLSGTCSAPPIAQCDHLAAIITQADGSIAWRGQEPQPYPMSATGQNSWAYSGRTGLNNGNISFALGMTSEGTWSGTMSIVYDSDPLCTHTFYYTAERIR